uniref:Reverse transcriptase domain-containing protein n=1 Tax=Gadus morhua TaxID=8049 RepID=A0A8C5A5S3_GADMO
MCDDINREIEAGNVVIVILLDPSAAFDTIDHTELLEKLLNDYGVTGSVLQWMKSYLEKRYFCVKIDDMLSSFLELLFGVPQGSILGPILFILYIKALQKIAGKYGLDIQLYADDSHFYISFHLNRASQLTDVRDRTNRCLAEIKVWMVNNFMKLNESKTELLVLGKSHVLKQCELNVNLQFGSMTILPTECKGDSWKMGVSYVVGDAVCGWSSLQ